MTGETKWFSHIEKNTYDNIDLDTSLILHLKIHEGVIFSLLLEAQRLVRILFLFVCAP